MGQIGFMLGMDYKDPVRVGIDKSFADADWKRTFWDTKYCQEKASVKDSCVTLFEEIAEQTLSDPSSTYKTGVTVNHIFANCDTQGARCITTAKDSDKKIVSTGEYQLRYNHQPRKVRQYHGWHQRVSLHRCQQWRERSLHSQSRLHYRAGSEEQLQAMRAQVPRS